VGSGSAALDLLAEAPGRLADVVDCVLRTRARLLPGRHCPVHGVTQGRLDLFLWCLPRGHRRGGVFHRFGRMPGASAAIHLKPATDLAERVLLPGDPHRALAVAQALTEQPKMFNHHRGLWGYTGVARDGRLLTIQATGMGGPSAAIVVEELIALGARTFIRIGTCGAIAGDLAIGEIVTPTAVLGRDGTSRALGATEQVLPDPQLAAACAVDTRDVVAASVDLFYGAVDTSGADVVEMECAALFQLARLRGVRAAAVLGVSDELTNGRRRIAGDELEELGIRLGETAWAALTR
jgi:uridine phosphorylase